MTDHLEAARADLQHKWGAYLECAIAHILDHLEAQRTEPESEPDYGPRPDGCCGTCPPILGGGYDCTCADNPRCDANKADRYDRNGDRWEWCDRCGGFRMARYHYGKPKRHLGLSVAMLDEDCGPLTFAPQPADTPTTAPQPGQAHGDAAQPAKPELNVQIESWTAIYDGGEIVSSAGFSAWLEAHDAELREQIAGEIEALPNLSIRSFGTGPLPDLIRKDTATRIARGEQL